MELFYQLEIVEDIKLSFSVHVVIGTRQGITFKKDPHKRQISLEVLKSYSNPLDQHLLNLLIKETKSSVDYSCFQVSKENGSKILKALNMTCKLLFQERLISIYFDQKALVKVVENNRSLELYINQEKVNKQEIFITDRLCRFDQKAIYQYDFSFPKRLLSKLQVPLNEEDITDLQLDYDDVLFERSKKESLQYALSPTPCLKLKDRTGAFADLLFDYQGRLIDKNSSLDTKKRNIEEEKLWEEDLLKTGFIKKVAFGSNYYCPIDKVAKSIMTLIDCGWKVLDTYDRKVIKGQTEDIQVQTMQEKIHLTGKVNFSGEKLSLDQVYGAFCRRQAFLELTKDTVGLLDFSTFSKLENLNVEADEKERSLKFHQGAFHFIKEAFDKNQTLDDLDAKENTLQDDYKFTGVLYPYQQIGVDWLKKLYLKGHHGLLADDMGLGKTVQVIAFLASCAFKKALVVVPFSLIIQWQKEIAKFYPDCHVTLYHGKLKKMPHEDQKSIILTTYGQLREDKEVFLKTAFDLVILDEAQAVKNSESQAFQIITKMRSKFRLNMTGTPIENNLNELFSHFDYLMPGLIQKDNQLDHQHTFALKQLKKLIEPYILRRKKQEVLKQLPQKIEQIIYVPMDDDERASYEQLIKEFKGNHKKQNSFVFETILRLRQHCCHPNIVYPDYAKKSAKFDKLVSDVLSVIDSGQKVVVFSSFVTTLQKMKAHFQGLSVPLLYLDGSTSNRQELVDQFQNSNQYPLFLMSMKAGGVGLNLTAADYVMIYDPWWNDAVENQAIDRAHRIGREGGLIAYRYILEESIEEKILKLKQNKSKLSADVLDEQGFMQELSDLIE